VTASAAVQREGKKKRSSAGLPPIPDRRALGPALDSLRRAKAAGLGFEAAWGQALRTVPARDWQLALAATRDEWQRCYEDAPSRTSVLPWA
jgi:hypothetical protein